MIWYFGASVGLCMAAYLVGLWLLANYERSLGHRLAGIVAWCCCIYGACFCLIVCFYGGMLAALAWLQLL